HNRAESVSVIAFVLIFNHFTVVARRLYHLFFEITFLIYENKDHANGDCGVRDIEYRPKEEEILTAPNGEPIREVAFNQRKIEHIDNLAVEDARITATGQKKLRAVKPGAFAEDHSVEGGVDDVTHRAGENQGDV